MAEFKTYPQQEFPPASASCALTATYLAAPSRLGRADCHTQGKLQQPQQLQWSRDGSARQGRTGLQVIIPTHGGWEPRDPHPKPKDAGFPSFGPPRKVHRPKMFFPHLLSLTLCLLRGTEASGGQCPHSLILLRKRVHVLLLTSAY